MGWNFLITKHIPEEDSVKLREYINVYMLEIKGETLSISSLTP
jgi:hypothetical protein